MDTVYNALKEAVPLLNKLDSEFQLDQKLATEIFTAYKKVGSHGNGLLSN